MILFKSNQLHLIRKNKPRLYKRGQSMLDYVVFLTVIIAALILMGVYIRNSLSGKLREGADVFGRGETYVPNVDGVTYPTSVELEIENISP